MIARTREEGREVVDRLVRRFEQRLDYYKSDAFDETATREQYINQLFQALGWDVLDEAGFGPAREVLYHVRLTAGGASAGEEDWDDDLTPEEIAERLPRVGIPDYAFRLHQQTKFFVEAKKPATNLRRKAPNYQVKSYAWNEQVPIGVLADFERLRVFLCVQRPEYDRPDQGLIDGLDLKFTEFVNSWDRIWNVLSKDAVVAGSLDALARGVRQRVRGALRVDESFLRELTTWRERVAVDLLQRNPTLDRYELAEATQRILDRLVFLRVCEDRNIEATLILRRYARLNDAYRRLVSEFRRLDAVYNGQLFADHFSERLELSDAVFQRLVESFYAPFSPYRFDVIGPDLLGSIYERFLGKELDIDPTGAVRLVDKPEVRHAGGVYYTPKWIVGHIVERTIGPLLEGKTPRAAANIRIVDPACGSGSFLLGALEYLIDWHERYYEAHPGENPDRHFVGVDGRRRLTSDSKATILVNCIHGVDIDPQAVEVTQMSLYLKVLEEETQQTLQSQQRLFRHAYLPPLDQNIRSGNALLAPSDVPSSMLAEYDLARRVNPFDWQNDRDGFGRVFGERGGFDIVIGNPPYTRTQVLRRDRPDETTLYATNYRAGSSGSFDIAGLFVERGISLLRHSREPGRLGFIISRQFTEADYGRPLRRLLSADQQVEEIVDFGAGQVFEGASAYTLLLFLSTARNQSYRLTRVSQIPSPTTLRTAMAPESPFTADLPAATLQEDGWDLTLPEEQALLDRLRQAHPSLGQVAHDRVFQGVVTGADFVFRLDDLGTQAGIPGLRRVRRRDTGDEGAIEEAVLRPVLGGRTDIQAFWVAEAHEVLLLPYARPDPTKPYVLIPPESLKRQYPHAYEWLKRYETELLDRTGAWTAQNWYALSRRQNLELFDQPKVLIPYMVERLCAYHDPGNHFLVNVSTGGYGMPNSVLSPVEPDFLVALLSSGTLSWVLRRFSRAWRGDWFAARKRNLIRLPIAKATTEEQEHIIRLYTDCGTQRELLEAARMDASRALRTRLYDNAVENFDRAIEDLYHLTDGERKLVRAE